MIKNSENSPLVDSELFGIKGNKMGCTRNMVLSHVISIVLTAIICGSAFAIYLYSIPAVSNPTCSGNGVYYEEEGACECHNCFTGSDCGTPIENCVIQATAGNPYLFEEYWKSRADIIPPLQTQMSYRLSYYYQIAMPLSENSTSGFSGLLNTVIRQIHKKYNNVETDGYQIVITHGGTQGIYAAVYALCAAYNKSFIVFSKAPHYGDYISPCTFMPQCCTFSSNPSLDLNSSEELIEFVTHPNNPDGELRERVYINSTLWIHDAVYYWPHLMTGTITPKNAPITIVSMSKFIGHAGTRFGWLVIKDPIVAMHATVYVISQTFHVSVDAAHRAYNILQKILTNEGDSLMYYIKVALEDRWDRIEKMMNDTSLDLPFVTAGNPDTWYWWLRCTNLTEGETCNSVIRQYGIQCKDGTDFGTPGYARIPLSLHVDTFDLMMQYFTKKTFLNSATELDEISNTRKIDSDFVARYQ